MKNKCLGVFLIFLVFPFIILSILELSIVRNLTSANFYKQAFLSTKTYSRTAALIQSASNPSEVNILTSLSGSMDENWLKQNTEVNLEEYFRFLNGKTEMPNLAIDLSNLKKNLKPTADLPAETIKLIPDKLSFDTYKSFLTDLESEVKTQGAGQDLADIQNQIKSAENISTQYKKNLDNARRAFIYSKIIYYAILLFTLLLLLAIGLAAKSSWAGVLRWIGNALVYPSGILAIIMYIAGSGSAVCLKVFDRLNTSNEIKILLKDMCFYLIKQFTENAMRLSLIVFGIGALFIIVSYIISAFSKKPPTQPTSPPVAKPSQV